MQVRTNPQVTTRNKLKPLKCPSIVTTDSTHMTDRPEVLLSRADYIEDIKIRWQIHQYEVKKLADDISCLFNMITDKVYYTAIDR